LKGDLIKVDEGEMLELEVEEDILKANERIASINRKLLDLHGIRAFNFMGAIGSGKTEIIERLVERLKGKYRIFVIAGDVTTTIDADRIKRHGVRALEINTGRECHLDALMIKKALKRINLDEIDLIFIENVGNLICPADFPLGTHMNVVVVSVTEGPNMVKKHPFIIREADVVVINKIDLADVMEVNVDRLVKDARELNPRAKIVLTSARRGLGIDDLIKSLEL